MQAAGPERAHLTSSLNECASFLPDRNLGRFLPLAEMENLYQRIQQSNSRSWFERVLSEMRVTLKVDPNDLKRIPTAGSVLVVANHPFGILDGATLGVLLSQVRSDAKIMTNLLLSGIPELHECCIFVDPFKGAGSTERNRRAMKEAMLWLREGHLLAVFPAGEVSRLQPERVEVTDPEWNPVTMRLARATKAVVVPVFFHGRNSAVFQMLSLVHPGLRTAWIMREFLSQAGKTVQVRIGTAISRRTLEEIKMDQDAIEYVRRRTYLLAHRPLPISRLAPPIHLSFLRSNNKPIAMETSRDLIAAEIQCLPSEQCIEKNGELSVYFARPTQIPSILQELGRLRELTFREVGEGTGKGRDLDQFDDYYGHLFLWDENKRQLAGAYRMGLCPEILATRGPDGLYTSTLFRYDPPFFEKLGPAIELGRSFVVPEYQRQFSPLLLLWKGIARYVSMHPHTPVLFGAVSISKRYSAASRELIVRYFESRQPNDLANFVHPRRPFRPLRLRPWDCNAISRCLRDLGDLGDSVSDLEPDAKGLPILVRQYANVGGTVLAFNVDRNFSNCLDGLVFVDLRFANRVALERYMGYEGLRRFYEYQRIDPTRLANTTL